MTAVEREPVARTRREDPADVAKRMLETWWELHARRVDDDAELYDLVDHRVQVLVELLKLTTHMRGGIARGMRGSAETWREVAARTGRPESTLRSQAKE